MDRVALIQFIAEQYSAHEENPWKRYPNYAVFRHRSNQKWFALMMNISKSKLGLPSDEMIDVLNVKCDPMLISTLRNEKGVYPAYHMNKENWLTLALDGSIKDDQLKWLLDQSFELTASKKKQK
ncbi:MmcQ/YjbR family DNA-binding protein [Eubacterium sp. AM05-23]|uniref:MmcQ/YjbR family DNA-binding protein n=1 Tax=Eubacterium TaxID=1730 RepID=UPI000E47C9CF|nr:MULTISPECIES: MmcQ/YjbR family DNA-binding protein [Eubacterium]RHO59920.1 MmcQ/YjbR family DNA-binding protein [Eubacterium sp. AM05-23]